VLFALAKNWLLLKESGALNEEACGVSADLRHSLPEQSARTTELLEQSALPASPLILSPAQCLPRANYQQRQGRRECDGMGT